MIPILRNTIHQLCILLLIGLLPGKTTLAVTAMVSGALPAQVNESSGVDFTGTAGFWTHNDGVGDNKLYLVNNTGSLVKTITVQGATNTDWEDITHDAARQHMYIGDFGNNACMRTNLHIYKIPYPSTVSGTSVTAQVINFSYPDQTQFPSPWMNFDAEGFFHLNGRLYLFSKADGSAVGYTKMYTLPDAPGTYVATLVDSFYTNDRTTSAALSPDGTAMLLISNTHIHIFRNFPGTNFFEGQHTQISISGAWTQKEGITFADNQTIYMTDENNGSGNYLYYMDLSAWLPLQTTGISTQENEGSISVYPNPARSFFTVEISGTGRQNLCLQLYDMTGKMVRESRREFTVTTVRMDVADLPSGVYFYKVFAENRELQTSRLIISH